MAVCKALSPATGSRSDFRKLNGCLQDIQFGHGVQGAKPPCKIIFRVSPPSHWEGGAGGWGEKVCANKMVTAGCAVKALLTPHHFPM